MSQSLLNFWVMPKANAYQAQKSVRKPPMPIWSKFSKDIITKSDKHSELMYREHQDKHYITGRFGRNLSEDAKNLMRAMFEFEDAAQIEVAKILKHDWVVHNFDSDVISRIHNHIQFLQFLVQVNSV